MKRLKVCALALGMMLAGSVVAMDTNTDEDLDRLSSQVRALYGDINSKIYLI